MKLKQAHAILPVIAFGLVQCDKEINTIPQDDTIEQDTIGNDTISQQPPDYAFDSLPNIVFIFADDLGYGDIGSFGANDIATPNIDRMAAEGIKFTEFYSASSICSPSRAALLTGRYPQRSGVYSVFFAESVYGMPSEEITIAEILKEEDYITGIIGKWHLGHQFPYLPLQQGFDSYFGIPYSNDMNNIVYMRDNAIESSYVDQHYITKTYTEEALTFMDSSYQHPFFLYLAHNMPHIPIYASPDFLGKSNRGLYGDVVQEIDWSVGQILNKLEELEILEKTLVIFTSDNGPWLVMEEDGGSAGILREGKNFTFEGGMRVPTVAMWKGTIPEGIVYDDLATQMDWLPTFANITGASVPGDRVIDGIDITHVLLNQGMREDSTFLYLDEITGELQCYRKGKWKIKKPYPGYSGSAWKSAVAAHDTLLIDLKADPGEGNNLYETNKEFTITLFNEMKDAYSGLGPLADPIPTR